MLIIGNPCTVFIVMLLYTVLVGLLKKDQSMLKVYIERNLLLLLISTFS